MTDRPTRWYHGGVDGLRPGDKITPGHVRKHHDGCHICAARAAQADGGPAPAIDPLAEHPEHVYITSDRLYAKHYASLYGRGDLYQVVPDGETWHSDEDSFSTMRCASATVVAALDRAVLLTRKERQRLYEQWGLADLQRLAQHITQAAQ